MKLLIALGIIVFVLLLVLFIPIGVGAKYENGGFVLVKIAFKNFEIPINKVIKKSGKKKTEDSPEKTINKSVVGLDFILSLLGDFRRFVRKRFSLKEFDLEIVFGTADAASTAVTTGHLWALSYNLLGLVDKLFYVDNPRVNIIPRFSEATFFVSASGIIVTRLAHIIATLTVFAYKFFKYKRNKTRRNLQ